MGGSGWSSGNGWTSAGYSRQRVLLRTRWAAAAAAGTAKRSAGPSSGTWQESGSTSTRPGLLHPTPRPRPAASRRSGWQWEQDRHYQELSERLRRRVLQHPGRSPLSLWGRGRGGGARPTAAQPPRAAGSRPPAGQSASFSGSGNNNWQQTIGTGSNNSHTWQSSSQWGSLSAHGQRRGASPAA